MDIASLSIIERVASLDHTVVPESVRLAPAAPGDASPAGVYRQGDRYLIGGEVCLWTGDTTEVTSPICTDGKRTVIGRAASLTREESLDAMAAAVSAWDHGRGEWPTMRVGARLERAQTFVEKMKGVREESVRLLMWEIAKTRADSEKEFDRTVAYIEDTINALKEFDRDGGRFTQAGGVITQIRRAPLGPTLCMGPFNYPLNETFTTLIPALLMGNPIVCKLPKYGALCQGPLLQAFAECFPAGAVNVINGEGPTVVGPLLESGALASLAFIGTARVANILKRQHPKLNRMRCILGLEAKNPAIILPDADLDLAVKECVAGALSYNGQRCTGLKLIWVHRKIETAFLDRLAAAVDKLGFGAPWEPGVQLTPLPEEGKTARLQAFVDDAVAQGAQIVNQNAGIHSQTFYFPAVVRGVKAGMALHSQEQFGPIVPVSSFDDVSEVLDWLAEGAYGQQASLFGRDPVAVGSLCDVLSNLVCRVNLNAQCQRGPDVFPFTGRKDSAEGTLSVSDALRSFSIRSMVAAPSTHDNRDLLRQVLTRRTSKFVSTDYLF